MITVRHAIDVCVKEFPKGLDRLVEMFSISVEDANLNVDGWCFREFDGKYVIRLNRNAPPTRKRFTLAHEIAHFILGSDPGDFFLIKNLDDYDPRGPQERDADELASQLLLPFKVLQPLVVGNCVDCNLLRSIARKAKVSEAVVALRFVKLGRHLALKSPTVFHVQDGRCKWKFPFDSIFPDSIGLELHRDATSRNHRTLYKPYGDVKILASVPPNPVFPIVFAHCVDAAAAEGAPDEIEIEELKRRLFTPDRKSFQSQLAGKLGAWSQKNKGARIDEAFSDFVDHYDDPRLWYTVEDHELFTTDDTMDYVYLKLKSLL